MTSPLKEEGAIAQRNLDFLAVESNEKFKQLLTSKKKFIVSRTIFFLIFYFGLPVLAAFTKILHQPAIGDISWVWVYAVAQFIMTWTLVMIYMKKAAVFDQQAEEILFEEMKDGGSNI